jgi:alginate O-acetyltransferase complex protein AlgJ
MQPSLHPAKLTLALACACSFFPAIAQEPPPGIVGKNEWLFYRHEFMQDPAKQEVSVELIGKLGKALQANGTQLFVAMAPIKARIYAEHLPNPAALTPALQGDHARLLGLFQKAGVPTADLSSAFMNSPKRTAEFPLYFRQDTHWSATGALLAAETIRDALLALPATRTIIDALPVSKQNILWATQKFPITGDLIQQLPANAPKFEKELATAFEIRKESAGGLLDNSSGGIALLGSSYTADWTHFPKALGFALQRDVPALSVDALRGQWVGMEIFLRNEAFQAGRPRLLIWELPERDIKSPPSMPYREARYVLDDQEWLARVTALVQKTCTPAGNKVQIAAGGLGGKGGTEAQAPATSAQDHLELSLAQASSNSEYLSLRVLANGSKTLSVEATGAGVPAKKFTLELAGDEAEHEVKTPLFSKGKGYTKVRLVPGATRGFSVKDLKVCQQPA